MVTIGCKNKVQLTDNDIKEIKYIAECLQAEDEETFKLGQGLFNIKFPINIQIPIADILIPLLPLYDAFVFNKIQERYIMHSIVKNESFFIMLLLSLIQSKYYVVL